MYVSLVGGGGSAPASPSRTRGLSGDLLGAGEGLGLPSAQEDRVGVVVLPGSSIGSSVCASFVGVQKKRMCTLTNCGIAAHSKTTSKASGLFAGVRSDEPLVFICFKTDGLSVYTLPVRKVSEFGASMDRYIKDQQTVTSWVSFFAFPTDAQPKTEEDFIDVVQRADMVFPHGFMPRRKKICFTIESPETEEELKFSMLPDSLLGVDPSEVSTSLGTAWPALVSNQAQLEVLLRRIKDNSKRLALDLSGDWDASTVRFKRIDRKLGSWPAEFATSNLCTLATDLSNDLDQLSARVGSIEDKKEQTLDIGKMERRILLLRRFLTG
jgi:hypothetical protein